MNSEILCKKNIERDFHEIELKKTLKQVVEMDRNELFRDRTRESKDPQTILVSTWHLKLSAITSTLKNNFHIISFDAKLSKIFKQKPTVTYQKDKSLSDYLLKKDIANQQLHPNVATCGKRKLCPQINTAKRIINDKLNGKLQRKGNHLRCKMLQAQDLVYWTYRGTTFRALLQTSLHQKTGQTTANLQNIFTIVTI